MLGINLSILLDATLNISTAPALLADFDKYFSNRTSTEIAQTFDTATEMDIVEVGGVRLLFWTEWIISGGVEALSYDNVSREPSMPGG